MARTTQEALALLASQLQMPVPRPIVLLLDAAVVSEETVEDWVYVCPNEIGRTSWQSSWLARERGRATGVGPQKPVRDPLSRPLASSNVDRALEIAESSFFASDTPAFDHLPERGKPLSILVADDNRTNQMVLNKILELADHKVVLVDDGEAALDALEEDDFDIVLMDVNMPVLNGIDATKLYRFGPWAGKWCPLSR